MIRFTRSAEEPPVLPFRSRRMHGRIDLSRKRPSAPPQPARPSMPPLGARDDGSWQRPPGDPLRATIEGLRRGGTGQAWSWRSRLGRLSADQIAGRRRP
jgi:hypothetical protein